MSEVLLGSWLTALAIWLFISWVIVKADPNEIAWNGIAVVGVGLAIVPFLFTFGWLLFITRPF